MHDFERNAIIVLLQVLDGSHTAHCTEGAQPS